MQDGGETCLLTTVRGARKHIPSVVGVGNKVSARSQLPDRCIPALAEAVQMSRKARPKCERASARAAAHHDGLDHTNLEVGAAYPVRIREVDDEWCPHLTPQSTDHRRLTLASNERRTNVD